jgi:hypothetical protein
MHYTKTLIVSIFALSLLGGCGGSEGNLSVEGTVTKGSAPYTPVEGEKINITIEGGGSNYSTEVDASGKFKIEKVKAGKYNVSVTTYKSASGPTKGPPPVMRLKDGWEVSSGSKPVTLDLSQLIK